jgi:hypothetical protein
MNEDIARAAGRLAGQAITNYWDDVLTGRVRRPRLPEYEPIAKGDLRALRRRLRDLRRWDVAHGFDIDVHEQADQLLRDFIGDKAVTVLYDVLNKEYS